MNLQTALKHFSMYIRLRDSDTNGIAKCCTCPRKGHWKEMDAGHFVKRRAKILLMDEMNCYAQCPECNRMHDGKPVEMAFHIDGLHGLGTAQKLIIKGNQHKHLFPFEIDALGDKYRELTKEQLKRVAA